MDKKELLSVIAEVSGGEGGRGGGEGGGRTDGQTCEWTNRQVDRLRE